MKLPKGVYCNFRRDPDGVWRGELRFQLTDGGTGFRVSGTDEGTERGRGGPGVALARAVTTARALTANPQVAALLPPGSHEALSALRSLARAQNRGSLARPVNGRPLYQHFSGSLGKLARSLHDAGNGSGPPLCLADGTYDRPPRPPRRLR